MTKGQMHPIQHHKIKEETFRILHGNISLQLNHSDPIRMGIGDEALVKVGVKHSFKALTDCIIKKFLLKA